MKRFICTLVSLCMLLMMSIPALAADGQITEVKVVGKDGYTLVTTPAVGEVLTANIELSDGTTIGSYPVNPDVTYKWYYDGSDAILGTAPTYTVTNDNRMETLCLSVTYNETEKIWKASSTITALTIAQIDVVDGTDGYTPVTVPEAGQKLTANVTLSDGTVIGSYPPNPDVHYRWYYKDSYDTVLGTEPTYTVTGDNQKKVLCVEVRIAGIPDPEIWEAEASFENSVTGVNVVDGTDGYTPVETPDIGQKLIANIQTNHGDIGSYPVNTHAHYKWYYQESPDTVLGTEPVYTVTSDNLGKTICVEVSVDNHEGTAIWEARGLVRTLKVIRVDVVDGTDGYTPVTAPVAGQKLTANIVVEGDTIIGSYPLNDRAHYKWYYKDSPDTVLGTEPVYTVTGDNEEKILCVDVYVDVSDNKGTWEAEAVFRNSVTGVAVVDGTDGYTSVTAPVVGQKLTVNIQTNYGEIGSYPVNTHAHYKWYYNESPDTVLGTEPVYTVTGDNLGKTICVEVSVDEHDGTATWTASKAVAEKSPDPVEPDPDPEPPYIPPTEPSEPTKPTEPSEPTKPEPTVPSEPASPDETPVETPPETGSNEFTGLLMLLAIPVIAPAALFTLKKRIKSR